MMTRITIIAAIIVLLGLATVNCKNIVQEARAAAGANANNGTVRLASDYYDCYLYCNAGCTTYCDSDFVQCVNDCWVGSSTIEEWTTACDAAMPPPTPSTHCCIIRDGTVFDCLQHGAH